MALPAAFDPISIQDVVDTYKQQGGAEHSLSEYYGIALRVPSSGAIRLSDFYKDCPASDVSEGNLGDHNYWPAAFESVCWTNSTVVDADSTVEYGQSDATDTGSVLFYPFVGVAGTNYEISAGLRRSTTFAGGDGTGLGYFSLRIYRAATHPLGVAIVAESTRTNRSNDQPFLVQSIDYTVPAGEGGDFFFSIAHTNGGNTAIRTQFQNVVLTQT